MRQTYENATRENFTRAAIQWGVVAVALLFAFTVACDAINAAQAAIPTFVES